MNDFDFEIPDLIGKVLPNTNELKILSVIGYGSFAVVYKAEDIDHNLFAVKCIVKKGLNSFQLELQYREAELLRNLEKHPNIVNLYQVIDTEENLFFVLDLCECDLFEAIVHNHGFGNQYTKEIFEILIDTVQYLHERNIYHRDLKPENILITVDGDIKIADFGLACSDEWSKDYDCGTLRYEPPECVDTNSKGYSPEKSDLWALGVILVNLRFERNPWAYASKEDNVYFEFSTNNVDVLQQQLGLSDEMNIILKNIFISDPEKRWTLAQLKEAILSIDEMYDESKYNPLPPKKSNHSSPIPITPNSKKDSPFTYTFSSENSSTFNNSPEFVKHYEDQIERNDYDCDEINGKEFTLHDHTYTNGKQHNHYYLLNRSSLSHFSFCSRNDEEDDDFGDEEDEQKQPKEEEDHEYDNEIKYELNYSYEYEHEHEEEDDGIEIEFTNHHEPEEIQKPKRKGKNPNLKIFCRDLENETFYLEGDLNSPRDNRLYRSIKVGSICSRHSPSLRSNGSCGSIRSPFDNRHPLRNDNHVLRPTPLRMNANFFSAEDENEEEDYDDLKQVKDQKKCIGITGDEKKFSIGNHEVPESWEDYSFDELLSDDSSVSEESINQDIVFSQLKIKTGQNYRQEKGNSCTNSPEIYSHKIATYYKEKLIGSPQSEVEDNDNDNNENKEEKEDYTEEEINKPIDEIEELNNSIPEIEGISEIKENEQEQVRRPEKRSEIVKVESKAIWREGEEPKEEEEKKEKYFLSKISKKDKIENSPMIKDFDRSRTVVEITDLAVTIPNFDSVIRQLSGLKEDNRNDYNTVRYFYQWKAISFFSKHSLLVIMKEITLLNINLIWMSSQPRNYSFLLKYYIPQLPLYLFIFSVQLIDQIKKIPSLIETCSLHINAEKKSVEDRNEKKISIFDHPHPNQSKNNILSLQTIVESSFQFNSNCKDKEGCLTLVESVENYPFFFQIFNDKPINYLDEPYSILTILFKILNNFIDIYHFSVAFSKTKYKIIIKTDHTYPLQLNINNTFRKGDKDENTIHDDDSSNEVLLFSSSLTSSSISSSHIKSFYNFVKLISNDLTKYYKNTQSSLEIIFLFLVEKFKLSFLMMFISSFQQRTFPLTYGINDNTFNSMLSEQFIILFHHFYSKFLYLLLRTCYV